MILQGWCSQNSQQSNAPGDVVRVLNFQIKPLTNGGNPNVSSGKVVGAVQLQNLTSELAAAFDGAPNVTITIEVEVPE